MARHRWYAAFAVVGVVAGGLLGLATAADRGDEGSDDSSISVTATDPPATVTLSDPTPAVVPSTPNEEDDAAPVDEPDGGDQASDPTDDEVVVPQPVVVPPRELTLSSSSAHTRDAALGFDYGVGNLTDGDPATSWQHAGDLGREPVGEWVRLDFHAARSVTALDILNGHNRTAAVHAANARVRTLEVRDDAGVVALVELAGVYGEWESIALPERSPTSMLELRVVDIHPGETFAEVAISELVVSATATDQDADAGLLPVSGTHWESRAPAGWVFVEEVETDVTVRTTYEGPDGGKLDVYANPVAGNVEDEARNNDGYQTNRLAPPSEVLAGGRSAWSFEYVGSRSGSATRNTQFVNAGCGHAIVGSGSDAAWAAVFVVLRNFSTVSCPDG